MDYINQRLISAEALNRLAGLLIHPLDLSGVAVLISAGRRVASVLRPALFGAEVAICLRILLHGLLF